MLKDLAKGLVVTAGLSAVLPVYAAPMIQMDMDVFTPDVQSVVGAPGAFPAPPIVAELLLTGDGQSYSEMKINVSWNNSLITLPATLPFGLQYPWMGPNGSVPPNPYFQSYFEGSTDLACGGSCAPVSSGDVLTVANLAPENGYAYSFGGFYLGNLSPIAAGETVPLLWIAFNAPPSIADSPEGGTVMPSVELIGSNGASVFATARSGTIPEPATLALMGIGLAGLGLGKRRRGSSVAHRNIQSWFAVA